MSNIKILLLLAIDKRLSSFLLGFNHSTIISEQLNSRTATVHLLPLPIFEDASPQNIIEDDMVSHEQCTVQVIPGPTTFYFDE